MSKVTPTQRSLKHLRKAGYLVAITERWNPFAKIRQDLFGVIDLLAVKDGETLGVQTTSMSNVSARIKKFAESEHVPKLRDAGWKLEIHGWDGTKLRTVDVS